MNNNIQKSLCALTVASSLLYINKTTSVHYDYKNVLNDVYFSISESSNPNILLDDNKLNNYNSHTTTLINSFYGNMESGNKNDDYYGIDVPNIIPNYDYKNVMINIIGKSKYKPKIFFEDSYEEV